LQHFSKEGCNLKNKMDSVADERTPLVLADWKTFSNGFEKNNQTYDEEDSFRTNNKSRRSLYFISIGVFLTLVAALVVFFRRYEQQLDSEYPYVTAAWSSKAAPFSRVDPATLNITGVERPAVSYPGRVFGKLLDKDIPLPTNAWFENFLLGPGDDPDGNKIFQVPYILDMAGPIPGIRTHACHVQANGRAVMVG
jgi:hypothetical protein